jgi:hypothetical protein
MMPYLKDAFIRIRQRFWYDQSCYQNTVENICNKYEELITDDSKEVVARIEKLKYTLDDKYEIHLNEMEKDLDDYEYLINFDSKDLIEQMRLYQGRLKFFLRDIEKLDYLKDLPDLIEEYKGRIDKDFNNLIDDLKSNLHRKNQYGLILFLYFLI